MKKHALLAMAAGAAGMMCFASGARAFDTLVPRTGDGTAIHWGDQIFDPQNPTVTHLYYDFRSQTNTTTNTVYTNSITAAEITVAQRVLSDITSITGGKLQFVQAAANIPSSSIINLGVGDLNAISVGGGGGGEVGLGGINSYFPNNATSFSSGFAWLLDSEVWDTTLGNGNPPDGSTDFYNVMMHEVMHSLGLGHSETSLANIMQPTDYGEKLGPAKDDIDGIRSMYGTNIPSYDVLTRTLASFDLKSFSNTVASQYNYFRNDSQGFSVLSYYVDAGTNTVTGTTTVAGFASEGIVPTFQQDGGIWTHGTLAIGGSTLASNQFSAGIYILNAGTMSFTTCTIAANGALTQTGGVMNGTTMTTAGTVVISGTQNWGASGTMTITGGGVTMDTDAGNAAVRNLAISISAGNLLLNATEHLRGLTLTGTSARADLLTDGTVLVTSGLSVAVSGGTAGTTLNLHTSDALVFSASAAARDTAYTSIVNSAKHSRNAATGLWTGTGITCDAAGSSLLTLAIVKNADLNVPFSASKLFDGEIADANSILIKYTYAGDVNLDGVINFDDYLIMDDARLRGQTAIYAHGDLNYDGTINAADYALIDANFAGQGGPLAAGIIAQHAAQFGAAYVDALAAIVPSAVPEPGSLVLLGVGAVGLLRRGRVRST